MVNLNRNIWAGWTPQDFVEELLVEIDFIMSGKSWIQPFTKRDDLKNI